MSITKKVSVKVLAVLCAVVCLVGCVLPVSASAGLFDVIFSDSDYDVEGSAPITTSTAVYALSVHFGQSTDTIAKAFEFKTVPDKKLVEVYENDDLAEVVYINSEGYICGLASGFTVLLDTATFDGVISTVATGVGGVFDMSGSAFDFLTSNDLCMFMLSISFAGIAVAFVGRSFKTARK